MQKLLCSHIYIAGKKNGSTWIHTPTYQIHGSDYNNDNNEDNDDDDDDNICNDNINDDNNYEKGDDNKVSNQ